MAAPMSPASWLVFFFFQAEDGIRDLTVTGVQTCALPIFGDGSQELSVIYAGDLAAALVAAAAPAAANRVYYAAHPAVTTSRALVRAIGRAVGREPRVVSLPAPLVRGLLWAIGSVAQLPGRATLLSSDKAARS